MVTTTLIGGTIFAEQEQVVNGSITFDNQIIKISATKDHTPHQIFNFPESYKILPGFIDLHIHGAGGVDVMDASRDSLEILAKTLAREGTTSFLATTMTASSSKIGSVLTAVKEYIEKKDTAGAEILGIHLEGPFISPTKIGAQKQDFLCKPEINKIKEWQKLSGNNLKIVTIAPELEGSLEFISYLSSQNIISSAGHTNATYAETQAAIHAGCTHATHLFNAMRGMHQREPGALTALLTSNQVHAEIIVDGIHLHPAIVDLIYHVKGTDKLFLVTDSMRAKCMEDGIYDLGDQEVYVKTGEARLKDGTLAGSTLSMSQAILNMMLYTQCDWMDVIKMACVNPAKSLNCYDRKGSLAAGKDADLVVLNDLNEVVMTFCRGEIAYQI